MTKKDYPIFIAILIFGAALGMLVNYFEVVGTQRAYNDALLNQVSEINLTLSAIHEEVTISEIHFN